MAEAAAAQKRKRGAQDVAAEADTKYRRISFRPSTRAAPPTLDVRQCDSPDPSSEGGLTPSVASTPGSPSDRTASQAFPSSPLLTRAFETQLVPREQDALLVTYPKTYYSSVQDLGKDGGFGSILYAYRPRNEDAVVIKRQPTTEAAYCETAYRELRNLLHLSKHAPHPAIVPVLDCWHAKNHLYIVEPKLDTDLNSWLYHHPKAVVPPQQRVLIMEAVLSALRHLHECNIIHRDLKPANVCMTRSLSRIQLVDLGSCRRPIEGEDLKKYPVMTCGKHVCTYAYRAPEMREEDSQYDFKADVWSAGCVFAEVLTKGFLFPSEDKLKQQQDAFSNDPRDLRIDFPHASDAEIRVLSACLARDPSARSSAGEAIDHLLAASPFPPRFPSAPASTFTPAHYAYQLPVLEDLLRQTVESAPSILSTLPDHTPQLAVR